MSTSAQPAKDFILADKRIGVGRFNAVSLFSAGGIADIGFHQAGFDFLAHVELLPKRAEIGKRNFPASEWIVGDVSEARTLASVVQAVGETPVDLLTATPPCQGLSSSNPTRGNRAHGTPEHDAMNRLMLEVPAYVNALRVRIAVLENVAAVLTYPVEVDGVDSTVLEAFTAALPDYDVESQVIDVADFGVPQRRRRAVVVAIRRDEQAAVGEPDKLPTRWPTASHAATAGEELLRHVTLDDWFEELDYQALDPVDGPMTSEDPLHRVVRMPAARHNLIASIRPGSGSSAWRNEICPSCEASPVPRELATCHVCGGAMVNRPIIEADEGLRLISGFHSSYQRMHPRKLAPPVMTNSNRVGGAYKIHPWQHRTLTPRECADLQTVPRFFDWGEEPGKNQGLVRELTGEALPTYFACQLATVLSKILVNGPRTQGQPSPAITSPAPADLVTSSHPV